MSSIQNNNNTSRIYPELLKAGHELRIVPQGHSMRPLLDGSCDYVIIKPKEVSIRNNDLVLYKNKEDLLVVHRVWKVTPSGFILLGDGNIEKECYIPENDIYGICTAINRKGKTFTTSAVGYRIYTLIWKCLYPIRHYLLIILNLKRKRSVSK